VSLGVSNCSTLQLAKTVEIGFPQRNNLFFESTREVEWVTLSESPSYHMLALEAGGLAVVSKQGRTPPRTMGAVSNVRSYMQFALTR
jgi:hypothetical protein